METLVILQARTTSSRLPGKALLPVAGYPSAVLAALRGRNRAHRLVVATSDDASDDALAEKLGSYGVPVFRGPLNDVLGRYYLASAHLSEDSVIVRLTGDNVVPDGDYVGGLADHLLASRLEYLRGNSQESRMPYGLGGEAFTVAALRRAHTASASSYDREHVGPWMSRNCRSGIHIPGSLGERDFSFLRCTIDDEEDYQRILRLFDGVVDPVHVGWLDLLQKLRSLPDQPSFRVPFRQVGERSHSAMTLGTVQLGMDYGLANRSGKPSMETAVALVRRAISHGVTTLDTARAYGDSESVIGNALSGAWRSRAQVITKLDPLAWLTADSDEQTVMDAIDESITQSCAALGVDRLGTVLLHNWNHHNWWDGRAWTRLLELRNRGMIENLGASVYEPKEAIEALQDPEIKHIQIPFNILDRRWREHRIDRAAKGRPDVVVHSRSAFLQGILLSSPEMWPVGDFDAYRCAKNLADLARKFERESVADLCVAYVRSQVWVTSVVVGCETMPQLEQDLRLFCLPKLTEDQCDEVEHAFPSVPDEFLNPSKWKINKWKLAHEPAAAQGR